MFVKPAKGLVIRDPDLLDLLPATGREVPDSDYWRRRLRDGDVVEADATTELSDEQPATLPASTVPSTAPLNNDFNKGDA